MITDVARAAIVIGKQSFWKAVHSGSTVPFRHRGICSQYFLSLVAALIAVIGLATVWGLVWLAFPEHFLVEVLITFVLGAVGLFVLSALFVEFYGYLTGYAMIIFQDSERDDAPMQMAQA